MPEVFTAGLCVNCPRSHGHCRTGEYNSGVLFPPLGAARQSPTRCSRTKLHARKGAPSVLPIQSSDDLVSGKYYKYLARPVPTVAELEQCGQGSGGLQCRYQVLGWITKYRHAIKGCGHNTLACRRCLFRVMRRLGNLCSKWPFHSLLRYQTCVFVFVCLFCFVRLFVLFCFL